MSDSNPHSTLDTLSRSQIQSITRAFNQIANGKGAGKKKSNRENDGRKETRRVRQGVVLDEDEEMEFEAVTTTLTESSTGGGGFLPADEGGGGFIPRAHGVSLSATSNSGGGYIPGGERGVGEETAIGGGGFLPQEGENALAGALGSGFFPAHQNLMDSAMAGGGFLPDGGGFLPTTTPSTGGGFLPDASTDANAGGFLLSEPETSATIALDTPVGDSNDVSLSSVPNLIPLASVPTALRMLSLPPDDEEILQVFHDVAEDAPPDYVFPEGDGGSLALSDGEEDGGRRRKKGGDRRKTITRDEFFKVCAVLLGGDEDEEADNETDWKDEEDVEEDDGQNKGLARSSGNRRRRRGVGKDDEDEYQVESGGEGDEDNQASPSHGRNFRPRRQTRSTGPVALPKGSAKRQHDDYGGDLSSLSDFIADSDEDAYTSKSQKKHTGKGPSTKVATNKRKRGRGKLRTAGDVYNEAVEVWDLFFVPGGSAVTGGKTKGKQKEDERVITASEVRKVADAMGEKMTDEEILEMLDFASSSKNRKILRVVCRENFSEDLVDQLVCDLFSITEDLQNQDGGGAGTLASMASHHHSHHRHEKSHAKDIKGGGTKPAGYARQC